VGHLPLWDPFSAPPLKKKKAYCPKARALKPVLSKYKFNIEKKFKIIIFYRLMLIV
jgi:hypothetical protein